MDHIDEHLATAATSDKYCVAQSQVRFVKLSFPSPLFTELPLATSVEVERTFSQGRLVLSHVRSRLSVQSTRALLCLGVWSLLGYVKDGDVKAAVVVPELIGDNPEEELAYDWDVL
jgi:hypothetical protein